MKIGIVGVPNAGKSTLFNAIIKKSQAVTANYPFCTIEPNIGKVPVADDRLSDLAKIVETKKVINARIDCVDIAGLIKGAASGEGLGNAFLENIKDIDLILHVVRGFSNPETDEAPNIQSDVDTVVNELLLYDMQKLEKYIAKNKKSGDIKTAQKALDILEKEERLQDQNQDEEMNNFCKMLGLLTVKPYLFVANVEESMMDVEADQNPAIAEFAAKCDLSVCSACFEYELTQVPELQSSESAIDKIIKKAYTHLNLITFFTAGKEEVRAWTAKKDDFIPNAAAAIHNDFKNKFIRAEVVSYNEFVCCEGWEGAKVNGKLRVEGKQYKIQDGDVCFFKI